jgi:hypothetical protein
MRHIRKYSLWILPILGFVLGLVYADIFYKGIFVTWHFIGKPDENIVRIIGIRDGYKLLVATETGNLFSLGFYDREKEALVPQFTWEREQLDTVDPVTRLNYGGADFVTLPPLFQVKQLYEFEYLYRVEGKGEVKFALATDGNLWIWNHKIAGLTGLVYYFYPVTGLFAGSGVALLIIGVNWLKRKNKAAG